MHRILWHAVMQQLILKAQGVPYTEFYVEENLYLFSVFH